MSEVRITHDFRLDRWHSKLRWADEKPVALAYCRVSTEDQADEGYSLDTQEVKTLEACDKRLGKGNYHLICIQVDESGPLPFDRGGMAKGTYREGLTLAVEIFRAGLAQYLVVYKMNRITRNLRIYLELDEDVLQPNDVEIFSATEPIGNRTAAARFFTQIIGASAESEHANIVSVSRDGLRSRIEKGYYTGQVPYGWRWDDTRPPRKDRFTRTRQKRDASAPRRNIEPDPETAPVVKTIFELYGSGKSKRQIAEAMHGTGAKTSKGTNRWTLDTVRKILVNPTHAGLVRVDGELVEGRHFDKRLIDPADYYAMQKRLESQAKIGPSVKRSTNHIFAEFTRCAICGRRMIVQARPKGTRYECWGNWGDVRHRAYSVLIERVENRVVECIRELAEDAAFLDAAAERAGALVNEEALRAEGEQTRLQRELSKAEASLVRWCERFNSISLDDDQREDSDALVYSIYRDKLTAGIVRLKERLSHLEESEEKRQSRAAQLEHAVGLLRQFPVLWAAMDLGEKRALAAHVIDELAFEPESASSFRWVSVRLKLILRDPVILRVPTRGRGGRESVGLDSLSRAELTAAYYYLRGYNDQQIAQDRDVCLRAVRCHKASLVRRTGAGDLAEALEMVAPLVEARQEELQLGRRRGRHFREHFTDDQLRVLQSLSEGASVKQMAVQLGKSNRAIHGALYRIYGKLGVHSAKEAVAEARRRRLVSGTGGLPDRPTEKQLVVLRQLCDGGSQARAAANLGLPLSSLKTRLRCMYNRFGVRSQAALLDLARERGWVE